jgi:hypothetical protein
MMIINNEYSMGEIVYLITDKEQSPRQIISITIGANDAILYRVMSGTIDTYHFEVELSRVKDIMLTTTN